MVWEDTSTGNRKSVTGIGLLITAVCPVFSVSLISCCVTGLSVLSAFVCVWGSHCQQLELDHATQVLVCLSCQQKEQATAHISVCNC